MASEVKKCLCLMSLLSFYSFPINTVFLSAHLYMLTWNEKFFSLFLLVVF